MMVVGRNNGLTAIAILALLGTSACGKQDASSNPSAKPQSALSAPAAGGRNAAANPAARPLAAVQPVDFGDDATQFAKDGECDDKRFSGPGMTDTPLLDSDIRHDATDCRAAFDQHRLTLASAAPAASGSYASSGVDHIMWGDDASKYSRDGECDDKRFTGPGLTETPLLDSDVKHDATDCRAAFAQGRLSLRE